jgi:peroxiredoxin
MKQLLLLCTILGISSISYAQKNKKKSAPKPINSTEVATTQPTNQGHKISITLTPYKNQKIYLGCYYGKGKALVDSCIVDDNSKGVFKGDKTLTNGIYFIVSPKYVVLFDILVGEAQNFNILADSSQPTQVKITGSIDNDIFKDYTNATTKVGTQLMSLNNELKEAKTAKDSAAIKSKILLANKDFSKIKDDVIAKNPDALLTTLLNCMKRPEVPVGLPYDSVSKRYDSAFPYRFTREHFWDDVLFSDERLLRTPFFEPKVEEYFKYYVSPESDSIIPEVKTMLVSARSSNEMFAYLLTKFTNKYITPEYMGQDAVFVYLFTDFYLKGDTTVLNPSSRKTIMDNGFSMMTNKLGDPAPQVKLTDTAGKEIAIYDVDANYVMFVYWDPNCGHCRTEIPVLDSIYKAKWKNLGIKVYSIIDKEEHVADMKKFVKEKSISTDWVQVHETRLAKDATEKAGIANFRQLYNLYKTPMFYLLDKEKRIIAKQLSIHQFDDLLAAKMRNKKK